MTRRGHNVVEDWQDNLRTARGIVLGSLIGAAFWIAFIWLVFPA